MEEYLYSPLIDTLLEWGKTKLLFPDYKEYLSLLEEGVRAFSPEDIGNELPIGVNTICAEAESGMETISKSDLILATPVDSIWPEAENGFLAFDRLVFLREALEYSTWSNEDVSDTTKTYVKQVDEGLQKVSDWLFAGVEFSTLRLAALNEFRRKRLKDIPKGKEDLFLWYHLFTEDEAPLDWLIENFNLLQEETAPETLPEGIHLPVELYMAELRHDKILARVLEEEHRLFRDIQQAVVSSLALRLFTVSDLASITYTLPPEIEAPGLSATASHVISSAPRRTPADRLALVLQTAFCGPDLTDEQRLEAFSWVEQNLKKVTVSEINTAANQILNALRKWINGEIGDNVLTETLFTLWIDGLKFEAELATADHADGKAIWNFVEGIMKESSEAYVVPQLVTAGVGEATAPWWKQGMKDWLQERGDMPDAFIISNYQPGSYIFPSLPVFSSDMHEPKKALKPPKIEGNCFEMEIFMPAEGKNARLLLPESDSDKMAEFENILQYCQEFDKYSYAVQAWDNYDILQQWKARKLPQWVFDIEPEDIPSGTTRIIIGLHPDEDTLNKVMTGKITNKDLKKEHKIEVFFVSFVPGIKA